MQAASFVQESLDKSEESQAKYQKLKYQKLVAALEQDMIRDKAGRLQIHRLASCSGCVTAAVRLKSRS